MSKTKNEYQEIYNIDFDNEKTLFSEENKIDDKSIKKYRVKTIRSGKMLEYECYPLWKISARRNKKINLSSDAQNALNEKNKIKKVIRLINHNFTDKDTWATFTYDDEHLPSSVEEAKKFMGNYIKRLRRKIKKLGLKELKYIYVTEYDPEKTRIHHHMIVNVSDRDMLEKMWKGGKRTHARRLQEDDNAYEGLARYITKDPRGKKSYTPSRNLKKPIETVSDFKMTKKKASVIASNENLAKEKFEKMSKNYKLVDVKVYVSDFISGAYIYAKLKRKE